MIPAIVAALGQTGAASAAGGSAAAAGGVAALGGELLQTAGAVQSLTSSVSGLRHPTSMVGKALNMLGKDFLEFEHVVTSVGQNLVNVLAMPINTIKKLGDTINTFTQLSNPAAVAMFEFKVENTFATIGRVLEPIMESLTRAAEKVGDTFAKIREPMTRISEGIGEVIDVVMDTFGEAVELVSPHIQMMSMHLQLMAQAFKVLHEPVRNVIMMFNALSRNLMELLGIDTGFNREARSDVAIRAPRFTTTEEMQREMARNSLMASLGQKKPETTESWLEKLYTLAKENLTLEKLKQMFIDAIRAAKEEVNPVAAAEAGVDFAVERERERDLDRKIAERRARNQE